MFTVLRACLISKASPSFTVGFHVSRLEIFHRTGVNPSIRQLLLSGSVFRLIGRGFLWYKVPFRQAQEHAEILISMILRRSLTAPCYRFVYA